MALNLGNLIKARQFRFKTKFQGDLLCHSFSVPVMSEAEQWLKNEDSKDSEKFARYLITLLCQPVDKEEDDDFRINKEQAESIIQSELEEFSRLFIEKNRYLLECQNNREIIRKEGDESETEYLHRVVSIYINQWKKINNILFESTTKDLFSSATLSLLKENQRRSDSLGRSPIHHEPFKFPEIPENPIVETNRHLASFGKELNKVAALIKSMNDLGIRMAMDTAATTARTKFWNNVMFVLGLITLGVTAIFSYLSYASPNDASNQVKSLLIEHNTLLKAQEENQKELIKAISSISPTLERGLALRQDQEQMLQEISAQLIHLTSQPSSQPPAARMPQSGTSN